MPVYRSIRDIPHVTPKVRVNKPYLDVYYQIILWQDQVKPNWMLYDNLIGIKSIPILFEYYPYCRIAETLNILFKNNDEDNSTFIFDVGDSKIKLLKEPNFWMVDYINSQSEQFVNTEDWTKYYNKKDKKEELRVRSSKGPNARRTLDVVIEITKKEGKKCLLILDAKYTYPHKAFTDYLPELTMKYVHGIGNKYVGAQAVDSLTIIYPNDTANIKSYHHNRYAFDGEIPTIPALQTVSLVPKSDHADELIYLLKSLLKLSGVDFSDNMTQLALVN